MNLKERAKALKINIPAVFIALKKEETPFIAKLFAIITVVYALSPIDLIPDFIPVLGYLDDVIVLPLFISLTIRFIPNEQFLLCQEEAKLIWQDGAPKKWKYAIPIIFVWIVLLSIILKLVLQ